MQIVQKLEMNEIRNNKPLVAIVLPVYNTERYLPECLASLIGQSYSHFHVFAVNDGSTDNSAQILNQIAAEDKRFTVVNKKNGGASSARNVALDLISKLGIFEYICFVDSDDIVMPNFLERFVSTMEEGNYDYCVCGVEHFNAEKVSNSGVVSHGVIELDQISAIKQYCHIDEWARSSSNICMTSRCFRSSLIGSERFDQNLTSSEDQSFILNVLLKVTGGVIIPDVLYRYRQRASSLSHSGSKASLMSCLQFAESLLRLKETKFPADVKLGLELKVCNLWWQVARKIYLSGDNQDKLKVRQFYKFIKEHCEINALPKKYRKRFLIFSLGDYFTSLYFRLNHREKKLERMFK